MIFAHTDGNLGGLADGLLHPLTGPDHVVVMVAIGVAALLVHRSGRNGVALGASFAVSLIVGAALGVAGWAGSWVEVPILASVIAGPLLIAAPLRRLGLPLAFACTAGLFHGAAHGYEAPQSSTIAFLAGMVLTTIALEFAGGAIGARVTATRSGRVTLAGIAGAGAVLAVLAG